LRDLRFGRCLGRRAAEEEDCAEEEDDGGCQESSGEEGEGSRETADTGTASAADDYAGGSAGDGERFGGAMVECTGIDGKPGCDDSLF
jgi:hypothetical protein